MKVKIEFPLVYAATAPSRFGPITAAFMDNLLIYLAFEPHPTGVDELVARHMTPPLVLDAGKRQHRQLEAIIDMIENNHRKRCIRMNAMGTPFQEMVWKQLLHIPLGSTWSYKQLAEAAGVPEKSRAVAGACAANPIAVLIPCHRVIQSTGQLGGYHWGTNLKADLLDMEAQQAAEMTRLGQPLTPIVEVVTQIV